MAMRSKYLRVSLPFFTVLCTGFSGLLNPSFSEGLKEKKCNQRGSVMDDSESTYHRENKLGVDYAQKIQVMTSPWEVPTTYSYIASAPRCMHDACWFPMARAYSIALYIQEDKINQFKQPKNDNDSGFTRNPLLLFDMEVNKTLSFCFMAKKERQHIVRGFDKALSRCLPLTETYEYNVSAANSEIKKFISLIRDLDFSPTSRLIISLQGNPKPGQTVVHYMEDENSVPRVLGVVKGVGLITAFHRLYLEKDEFGRYNYNTVSKAFENGVNHAVQIQ